MGDSLRKVRGVGESTKQKVGILWFWGADAQEFPGGLLRLDPAFACAEPPSSWPLPWAELLLPAVIEFQLSYSRSWKMMLWKVLHSICNLQYALNMQYAGSRQLCLSVLIPWNYLSLSLYNHKGFDLDDTPMVLFKYLNGLTAKYRLRLKKVVKTTKPFRYDLNQTPYDYTVKVTNRFKGIELIDRVPEELWTKVHNTVGFSSV